MGGLNDRRIVGILLNEYAGIRDGPKENRTLHDHHFSAKRFKWDIELVFNGFNKWLSNLKWRIIPYGPRQLISRSQREDLLFRTQ